MKLNYLLLLKKKNLLFHYRQRENKLFIKFHFMVIQVNERDCQPRQRTRKKARRLKKRREWRWHGVWKHEGQTSWALGLRKYGGGVGWRKETKWGKETHSCGTQRGSPWRSSRPERKEVEKGTASEPCIQEGQYPEVSHACHCSPRRRGER